MNWQLWVVVGYLAVSTLIWVGKVGRERKPVTPTLAVAGLVEYAAIIALVFWGAGVIR